MNKETNGPAFPLDRDVVDVGMTLRDYFAAKAMAVVMPAVFETLRKQTLSQEETDQLKIGAAAACYGMADAMLKAREQ